MDIKKIRIDDLKEAFDKISDSDSENIWYRELTAIENAIKYLEKN